MADQPLPTAETPPSPAAQLGEPTGVESLAGTLRCFDRGCPNRTGVNCGYVDRHGRHCLSAWCPDHRAVVDGVVYCRRHAGILEAVGAEGANEGLPELENRAPSLVNWIGNDIERDVRTVLDRLRRDGEEVAEEPVHLVETGGRGGRRWARSWSLRSGDEETLRVGLEVDERSDPEVAVRVGRDVVVRSIAPWIGHRLRGEWVPPHVDVAERQSFNRDLAELITATVTAERGEA